MPSFLQLTFHCSAEHLLQVEDALVSIETLAVTRSDAQDSNEVPQIEANWQIQRFEVILSVNADLAWAKPLLKDIHATDVDVRFLSESEWIAKLSQPLPLIHVGKFSVGPREITEQLPYGITVSGVNAFGTGHHPTTMLCLHWLGKIDLINQRVLDIGCGTGILSVAASKADALSVTAIENDPKALATAKINAKANNVSIHFSSSMPTEEVFDVVVTNIVTETLIELAIPITKTLAPHGLLALCGIRVSEINLVKAAYPSLTFSPPVVKEGWVLLHSVRRIEPI